MSSESIRGAGPGGVDRAGAPDAAEDSAAPPAPPAAEAQPAAARPQSNAFNAGLLQASLEERAAAAEGLVSGAPAKHAKPEKPATHETHGKHGKHTKHVKHTKHEKHAKHEEVGAPPAPARETSRLPSGATLT